MKNIPHKILTHIKDLNTVEAYNELTKIMGFTSKESSHILNVKTFDDLIFDEHKVVPKAIHSYKEFSNGNWISIVGGGTGLYGDGVNTFEVLTSKGQSEALGHLSKEEVTREMLKLQ